MSRKPIFVAVEGVDATGKATQVALLVEHLRKRGPTETISFPQYGAPSAYFVEAYLRGEFGAPQFINPREASLFYALDRYTATEQICRWLVNGSAVIADRYVGSNLAHQGGKLAPDERPEFVRWVLDLEYGLLGAPKPLVSIILWISVPAISKRLMTRRGKERDGHEKDDTHLQRADEAYRWLAKEYPQDFVLVECIEAGRELTPDEVHEKILATLRARDVEV